MAADDLVHVYCSPALRGRFAQDEIIRFHPPIRRGDLEGLSRSCEPGRALIVDGVFAGPLSLTGTECRSLMEAGWSLYGCSSLGALRAAELFTVGMVGLGRIHDFLRLGIITDDAELAAAYHPKSWREMTIPLVNIRFRLMDAIDIDPAARMDVWNAATTIFYMDRTEEELLSKLGRTRAVDHRLASLVRSMSDVEISQKRLDADYAMRALLAQGRETPDATPYLRTR